MKPVTTFSLILAVFISGLAFAQTDAMKGMDTQGMMMMDPASQKCADMKGMDMKDMATQKCKDMMTRKDGEGHAKDAKMMTHQATAVVKAIDPAAGKVTLAHEAIKSLNWPAMTMAFAVKDKMLLDKLAVGKQVRVELKKRRDRTTS
ncbi:copper-binding protein [Pseudoduganella sp. UC29_106]|uniref:copper-binding protein n=1 Tax=Pseudoduganella sp. UC29_106 TaxID=3374553 RepID=UPI0037576EAB